MNLQGSSRDKACLVSTLTDLYLRPHHDPTKGKQTRYVVNTYVSERVYRLLLI